LRPVRRPLAETGTGPQYGAEYAYAGAPASSAAYQNGAATAGAAATQVCSGETQALGRLREKAAGRKVRTPWSSRFTLWMKVFGIGRLRPKGDAPGNARGPILRAVRASEARFPATDSATENKPPVQCASVAIRRKTFGRPESSARKRVAEGASSW